MRATILTSIATLFVLITFSGCVKKFDTANENDYKPERLTEIFPLQTGKYITYQLDSTVFTNFGTNTETHSYQEKDVIDAPVTDALGRQSYRVYRFIRDLAGTQPWQSNGSYFITLLSDQVEVVDNNQRYVKVHLPIKKDFSWSGNQYLADDAYDQFYNFINDNFIQDWKFTYKSISDTFTYKQQKLSNIINIVQVDDRPTLDTVDVTSNTATIPRDSTTDLWLRGNVTIDTVRILPYKAPPAPGYEKLWVYNRTNVYATLNGIRIPPGFSLYFTYSNNKWYYPNPLTVSANKVTLPINVSLAYIIGPATDSIKVDVSKVDTSKTKTITIYNRSNQNAYWDFPTVKNIAIPPGYGRTYELFSKQWRLFQNRDILLDHDPYTTDTKYGTTSYSVEKYAKGIGLIYQELLLWEYQPSTAGQGGYKIGFGVKRSMIDHN